MIWLVGQSLIVFQSMVMKFKQRYLLGPKSGVSKCLEDVKNKLAEGRDEFRYRYNGDAFVVDAENA